MSRVDTFFELHDRMSRNLDRIRRAAERTELGIHRLEGAVGGLERQMERLNLVRAEPHVGLDTSEFDRKHLGVLARMRALGGMGRGGGGGVGAAVGTSGVNFGGGGMMALALIATVGAAIGPIVAGVVALGGGLAVAVPLLAALAGGFGVLAAVAVPALTKVAEKYKAIEDARKRVRDATTMDERLRALQELRLAEARLSGEERGLIENVTRLREVWHQVTGPIRQDVFAIAESLTGAARSALGVLGPVLRAFGGVFRGAAEGIEAFFGDPREQELLRRAWEPMPGILRQVLSILGKLGVIFQGLTIAAAPLLQWMLGGLERRLAAIAGTATSDTGLARWTAWLESLKPQLRDIGRLVGVLWDALMLIAQGAAPLIGPLADAIEGLLDPLARFLPVFSEAMIRAMQIAGIYTGAFLDGLRVLLELFNAAPPIVQALVVELVILNSVLRSNPIIAITLLVITLIGFLAEWERRTHTLRGAFEGFGQVAGSVASNIQGAWEKVVGFFSAAGEKIGAALKRVRDWFWSIKDAITGAIDRAKDFFDIVTLGPVRRAVGEAVDKITPWAEGGIVNRPTLGVFGERGPEALIPLGPDRRQRAVPLAREVNRRLGLGGGGGRPIRVGSLVTVTGVTINSVADYRQFMADLRDEVKRAAENLIHVDEDEL